MVTISGNKYYGEVRTGQMGMKEDDFIKDFKDFNCRLIGFL